MGTLLDVRGLNVVYHTQQGSLPALQDVSFSVQPGEIVGLVGESGCGKSSVAAALLRLLPANGEIIGGQILFKGRDLCALNRAELRALRGRELAMIFQDPMTSLNPVFSIGTQLLDVQRAHPAAGATQTSELRRRAAAMLERVGIPDAAERLDHFPHQFSGGMRQRIMIAMALLSRPSLLIADEPTSSLDVTLEAQILELMKALRASDQTAILLITHDLGIVAQVCDRVIVMYAGRVMEQADVFTLYEQPRHPYTQALLAATPSRRQRGLRLVSIPGRVPDLSALPPGCLYAERCPYVMDICRQCEPEYFDHAGHGVRCHRHAATEQEAAPPHGLPPQIVLRVEAPAVPDHGLPPATPTASRQPGCDAIVDMQGLSTYFVSHRSLVRRLLGQRVRIVRAVDQVDLRITRGEIVGLVGESGSGKTTLGKTILHLVPPSSGRILFDGQDLARMPLPQLRRLRARMQMIFQDPLASLSPRLRVSYLLTEPYTIHDIPTSQRYSVAQLLDMVGLSDEQADKYPHELSGGQARRVGIARALALHPKLLIADEPSSGLDVSVAASVLNLMKDLAHQLELTYLIITHNLNVVSYIADRVAVMYLGKLVEVGPTCQLLEAPVHPYTMALLSATSEPDPRQRRAARRLLLSGEIPSPANPPRGCRFHTRCPFARPDCQDATPQLIEIEAGHSVACHYWREIPRG